MDKTISLTFDIYKPVNPVNTFDLWRGDSVVFNFTFKGNGANIPLTDVDKLRVFAKRVKRDQYVDKDESPLFAADFTDVFTKASFGSTQTAGDAGPYLMTIMLMKGETVITAQGVYFNLLENGYAGIYQPSEDFRDEVVDAKNQAQAAAEAAADSATAAGNSSSAAASSASSADASAQQAAQDKADVAEMKTSVETAKASVDASAEQVAQDRAAAEAAAGTAVNATDLAALCRRAANVGFFQFDGGNAALAKAISSLPLSIAFMFQKTGDIANYTLYAGNNALGNASNTGICIAKNNGDTSVVQLRAESGGTLFQVYFNDTSLLDGKLHSVVVIVTDKLSLYIDGLAVSFSSGSWTGISASEIATPRTFYVGNGSGYALSRVKIFNFDMTAEGAPYTVADYAAGIEPSPALTQGIVATTDPTMGASTGEGWTQGAVSNTTGTSGDWKFGNRTTYIKNRELSQTDYDGGLPADITSAVDFKTEYAIGVSLATSMLCNDTANFAKNAGMLQKCRVSFWLRNNAAETSTSVDGMAIGMGYDKALQLKLSERDKYPFNQWVRIDEIVDFTFPTGLAESQMRIGISAHGTPNGSDLYTVSIADFKFEIIGANLALSDAADASQIRDKSGNGNHALISGAVLPSKENNPAHCSQTITWAGTSTLQNVCGNSAIPANCKVTAYAKATGAVTASFKAGAWAAQSKDLAANALTEIGSWLCGASGAFSVQPSAAYTGSIETYLTIERL